MKILAPLILGLLASLLFPPYFFLPLGLIIFPILCKLTEENLNQNKIYEIFKTGFYFSFSFFFNYLVWIINPFFIYEETKNYFYLSVFLILLLSSIFSIIFYIIVRFNKILPIYVIIPIIFVLSEFLISNLFYGFPWINFSLILSGNSHLSLPLRYFGSFITSYLVIQIFCLPYLIFKKTTAKEIKLLFASIIIPLLVLIIYNLPVFNNNKFEENKIEVEIFQLNKNLTDNNNLLNIENKILKNIYSSNADLIIFAENNYPKLIKKLEFPKIQSILNDHQNVVIGGTRVEGKQYYNSLLNISKFKVSLFDKKILVPFGEFLPLRKYMNFLSPISGLNDYSIGEELRLIDIQKNLNYIPIICYEIIFYWKIINNKNYNADFIVNITNDSWFGNFIGPYQHFYHTKIRAAEFNKPIIRVSNNGISGIFTENSNIIFNSKLNNEESAKKLLLIKNRENFYFLHIIFKIYFFTILFILILLNLQKYYVSNKLQK